MGSQGQLSDSCALKNSLEGDVLAKGNGALCCDMSWYDIITSGLSLASTVMVFSLLPWVQNPSVAAICVASSAVNMALGPTSECAAAVHKGFKMRRAFKSRAGVAADSGLRSRTTFSLGSPILDAFNQVIPAALIFQADGEVKVSAFLFLSAGSFIGDLGCAVASDYVEGGYLGRILAMLCLASVPLSTLFSSASDQSAEILSGLSAAMGACMICTIAKVLCTRQQRTLPFASMVTDGFANAQAAAISVALGYPRTVTLPFLVPGICDMLGLLVKGSLMWSRVSTFVHISQCPTLELESHTSEDVLDPDVFDALRTCGARRTWLHSISELRGSATQGCLAFIPEWNAPKSLTIYLGPRSILKQAGYASFGGIPAVVCTEDGVIHDQVYILHMNARISDSGPLLLRQVGH